MHSMKVKKENGAVGFRVEFAFPWAPLLVQYPIPEKDHGGYKL